jgi:hypothetical protein
MRARMLGVVVLAAVALPVSTAAAKCPNTRSEQAVSEAAPPAALAARLGVLRRAQTPADRTTIEAFKHQGLRILYARSLRLLRQDPDGRSWYLYAGKTSAHRYARACLRRMPASLRRTLLRDERRSKVESRKVQFGVFEFAGSSSGGFFGGTLGSLSRNLATLSVWHADEESTSVSGLVPDGVAWIDIELGDGERHVVDVTDNLWQVDVAAFVGSQAPRRTVWKSADGSVIARFGG